MTTLRPSGCLHTISLHLHHSHAPLRVPYHSIRQYASSDRRPPRITIPKPNDKPKPNVQDDYATAALNIISQQVAPDTINPPRSTRPPPLNLPEKDRIKSTFTYYLNLGRAYLSFYKSGLKAVWYNRKAANLMLGKRRYHDPSWNVEKGVMEGSITRMEFLLYHRHKYDVGKLPFFGVLVVVFGEWLPLIVPFIPYAVPGTCRNPSQLRDMRIEVEKRRRDLFRGLANVPSKEQVQAWQELSKSGNVPFDPRHIKQLVGKLTRPQFRHVAATLNLYGRLWDRITLFPSFLAAFRMGPALRRIAQDDLLLCREKSNGELKLLDPEELRIACETRGLDVLGKPEQVLRGQLEKWLDLQRQDELRGTTMLQMLLRRPSVWDEIRKTSQMK